MKKIVAVLVLVVMIGIGFYFYAQKSSDVSEQKSSALSEKTIKNQKLTETAKEVLSALSKSDYLKLEELTSPDGLTLYFEPQLNLTKIQSTKEDVSEIPTNTRKYLFGYGDATGDPINVTISQFIKKWIYTHDYEHAPEIAVNKELGGGNSINSIAKDIGNRDFVAFYFPGFDPKFEGMDWTTIYLVFDNIDGEYKLRAITKDNWTI